MNKSLISLYEALINGSSHEAIVKELNIFLTNIYLDHIPKIWHPLGFLMINLGYISDQESIRLHIWSDNIRSTQDPPWMIHNHNWTFKSYILCGKITNQVYRISNYQNAPTNKIYQVIYNDNMSNLIATEKLVYSSLIAETEFTQGEIYSMDSREFHSTIVENNTFAATIVLSRKMDTIPPEVIGDLQGRDIYSYKRIGCNVNQLKNLIDKLLLQIC